jgi:hypothetical protein
MEIIIGHRIKPLFKKFWIGIDLAEGKTQKPALFSHFDDFRKGSQPPIFISMKF